LLLEDNAGALTLALDHKTHPRTKHISLKYQHFLSHVTLGLVKRYPISTFDQVADIFTKLLSPVTFLYGQHKLIGR
jgi:hypothetical protein